MIDRTLHRQLEATTTCPLRTAFWNTVHAIIYLIKLLFFVICILCVLSVYLVCKSYLDRRRALSRRPRTLARRRWCSSAWPTRAGWRASSTPSWSCSASVPRPERRLPRTTRLTWLNLKRHRPPVSDC